MESLTAEAARRLSRPAVALRLRVRAKLQKGAHTCVHPGTSPALTPLRWKRASARGRLAQNTFIHLFIVSINFSCSIIILVMVITSLVLCCNFVNISYSQDPSWLHQH